MKGQLLLDTVRGMMDSQFHDDIGWGFRYINGEFPLWLRYTSVFEPYIDRLRNVVQLNQRTKIGNDICDKVSEVCSE